MRLGGVVFIAIGGIGGWMTNYLFSMFPSDNRTMTAAVSAAIVAFIVLAIGSIYIKGDVMIGGFFEKKSEVFRKVFGVILVVIAVIGIALCVIKAVSTNFGEDTTPTCIVCSRTFNEGSDNAKSIARSNMCENCYDNFEWRQEVQDVIDNQPVD